MNDPIVEQIRKYRDEYAARFGYDLAAIVRDIRRRQATCGLKIVSRPPKRVSDDSREDAHTDSATSH